MISRPGEILFSMLTYSNTGNELLDSILWNGSDVLMIISAVSLLLLILLNPNLRQHKRHEDRILFYEYVFVIILIVLNLAYRFSGYYAGIWTDLIYYILPSVSEFLYMMTILQWMIFVDYSLYRSMDHIRRRYRLAALPIIAVTAADILQSIIIYGNGIDADTLMPFLYGMQFCKMAVELGYILTAVHLVFNYEKETHQMRFIRLDAFIIPFVLGSLFRYYDASFMALGIILTYGAVIRRDRFIDHDTGFYSREFLDYLSKYRDEKEFTGGCGIMIYAPGHGRDMSKILSEIKPPNSNIFVLDEDLFLLLSGAVRDSASQMAVMMITEAAQTSDTPYTPEITTMIRSDIESYRQLFGAATRA